jgi:predicted site-specific integrase-resolvase
MRKKHKLTGAAQPTAHDLITDVEAAQYFSVEPRTLRLWRTKGLPFIRLTSKVIRFRKADLDEFAARRRVAIVN